MASVGVRRQRTLVWVVVAAIIAALLGFLAGRTIQSPADAAAEAEPPEASLITVPVELRELASNVVSRGDARREGSVQISVDASAGASSGGVAVVTAVPAAEGDTVDEGSVLLEVSERPVLVMQGELPMFRSLGPGSTGDDVEQLQLALNRAGFSVTVSGTFDEATERAVEQLYTQVGYSAPGLTDDEQAQLDAARESLNSAQASLNAATASLASLQAPLPESQRLQAEASITSARNALTIAEASETEANAQAQADLAAAQAALAAAQTPAELSTAQAEVDAAEATVARVAAEQSDFVASSKLQLQIAEAQYDEMLAPNDDSAAVQSVADARLFRNQASADLADIEARTGVRIPLAELVFVEALPTQIQRLDVERGDIIGGGPVMTVSGADVTIETAVSAADRPLINVGDSVRVDDESLGIDLAGTVAFLADEDGGLVPEGRFFVRVTLDEPAEQDIAGLNLRVTIPITSTGGEVLTVPLAALAAGGDGSVRVEVEDPDNPGVTRTVVVTTGLETTGFVEVTPVDGDLAVGDRVVVGQQ